MQKFKEADGGNPDGTAKDRVGATAGTKYFAKVWNDNFFNIFEFVEAAGYTLIDDDLEQFTKAAKGPYVDTFTYNTSSIVTQTVNDVVLGSDGRYYEAQANGVQGDDPVGSITGNWKLWAGDAKSNPTLAFTFASDADDTLTEYENLFGIIDIQDGVITGAKNLIVSNIERDFKVTNSNSFDVTIKTSAGTGITVKSGFALELRCDGANVVFKNDYSNFIQTGKNACTGWVNFDGSTTPPTIRDSYNVSSVIRTATGEYQLYFDTTMDNNNFSGVASGGASLTNPSNHNMAFSPTDVNSFKVESYSTANVAVDIQYISVAIFGGKN